MVWDGMHLDSLRQHLKTECVNLNDITHLSFNPDEFYIIEYSNQRLVFSDQYLFTPRTNPNDPHPLELAKVSRHYDNFLIQVLNRGHAVDWVHCALLSKVCHPKDVLIHLQHNLPGELFEQFVHAIYDYMYRMFWQLNNEISVWMNEVDLHDDPPTRELNLMYGNISLQCIHWSYLTNGDGETPNVAGALEFLKHYKFLKLEDIYKYLDLVSKNLQDYPIFTCNENLGTDDGLLTCIFNACTEYKAKKLGVDIITAQEHVHKDQLKFILDAVHVL